MAHKIKMSCHNNNNNRIQNTWNVYRCVKKGICEKLKKLSN